VPASSSYPLILYCFPFPFFPTVEGDAKKIPSRPISVASNHDGLPSIPSIPALSDDESDSIIRDHREVHDLVREFIGLTSRESISPKLSTRPLSPTVLGGLRNDNKSTNSPGMRRSAADASAKEVEVLTEVCMFALDEVRVTISC
jgi:hypothetical protein